MYRSMQNFKLKKADLKCVFSFSVVQATEIGWKVAKWPFKVLHRTEPDKDHYFSCPAESEMKVGRITVISSSSSFELVIALRFDIMLI